MSSKIRHADEPRESVTDRGGQMHAGGLAIVVWIWVFAGLMLGFFYTAIDFPFIPIESILWYGWVIAGYCLVACHACLLFSRGFTCRETSLALSVVLTMMTFALGWQGLVGLGDDLRFQARFQWFLPRYQRIVADVEHDSSLKSGWHTTGDIKYYVEQGPPIRVAFALPGGILDNWEGIVYDPSGEVSRAQEAWQLRMKAGRIDLERILTLFGGTLYRTKHIKGPWYRCGFT